jgi:hypothetical protein
LPDIGCEDLKKMLMKTHFFLSIRTKPLFTTMRNE